MGGNTVTEAAEDTTRETAQGADYTLAELMVAAASREIKNQEMVFVGMRLPLLAFMVAKRAQAPDAVALYENGIIRDTPASELLYTMGDPPNVLCATMATDMMTVMSLLQNGRVDIGFLGAGEVDRYGNLNSTQVLRADGSLVRLPGSGGAADIASLARRTVALMQHSRERLPERVSYLTSPGYGEGGDWRRRVGLVRGGTSCLITNKAVIRFDTSDHSARLESIHPGVTATEIRDNTGWDIEVPASVSLTPPPTADELKVIRQIDPDRFWTA